MERNARAANAEMAKEILDLIQRINKAVKSEKAMRVSLTSVLTVHKPRIFESGQDANNTKIGEYSTTPISIPFNKMARKVGSPRTIITKKRFNAPSVRETKSRRFEGGYKEYHEAIGKGSIVNLRNTDQMQMDYQLLQIGDEWGFGFRNDFNFKKSQWLQEKYDKDIFDLSQKELDLLGDVHKAEVEKLL